MWFLSSPTLSADLFMQQFFFFYLSFSCRINLKRHFPQGSRVSSETVVNSVWESIFRIYSLHHCCRLNRPALANWTRSTCQFCLSFYCVCVNLFSVGWLELSPSRLKRQYIYTGVDEDISRDFLGDMGQVNRGGDFKRWKKQSLFVFIQACAMGKFHFSIKFQLKIYSKTFWFEFFYYTFSLKSTHLPS
jgi:hypothetical protein